MLSAGLASWVWAVVAARSAGWLRLCGLGPEGGSDRVEVDKNGGPDGLEGGFSSSEVAAFARFVAVDDESEQALDARAGAVQVLAFSGVRLTLVVRLGVGPRDV